MTGWPADLDDTLMPPAGGAPVAEPVVLLGANLEPVGVAAKAAVHTGSTPLHAAFSCYLFDGAGRLLLTRRAESKPTWPGVWTNSCCGHPLPGERLRDAVTRRLGAELSVSARDLRLVLPSFRYRAEKDGVVEHEVCPVVVGRVDGSVRPVADEVAEIRWVSPADLEAETARGVLQLSPWALLQLPLLSAAGWGTTVTTPD